MRNVCLHLCGLLIICLGSWSIAYGLPQVHGCHPYQVENTHLSTFLKAASSDAPCVVGPVSLGGGLFLIWESHIMHPDCTQLPVFPCLHPFLCDLPPTQKKKKTKLKMSPFCVVCILTGAWPREDESFSACIRDRSHQLRRAVRCEQCGTRSPESTVLPAPQC